MTPDDIGRLIGWALVGGTLISWFGFMWVSDRRRRVECARDGHQWGPGKRPGNLECEHCGLLCQ